MKSHGLAISTPRPTEISPRERGHRLDMTPVWQTPLENPPRNPQLPYQEGQGHLAGVHRTPGSHIASPLIPIFTYSSLLTIQETCRCSNSEDLNHAKFQQTDHVHESARPTCKHKAEASKKMLHTSCYAPECCHPIISAPERS